MGMEASHREFETLLKQLNGVKDKLISRHHREKQELQSEIARLREELAQATTSTATTCTGNGKEVSVNDITISHTNGKTLEEVKEGLQQATSMAHPVVPVTLNMDTLVLPPMTSEDSSRADANSRKGSKKSNPDLDRLESARVRVISDESQSPSKSMANPLSRQISSDSERSGAGRSGGASNRIARRNKAALKNGLTKRDLHDNDISALQEFRKKQEDKNEKQSTMYDDEGKRRGPRDTQAPGVGGLRGMSPGHSNTNTPVHSPTKMFMNMIKGGEEIPDDQRSNVSHAMLQAGDFSAVRALHAKQEAREQNMFDTLGADGKGEDGRQFEDLSTVDKVKDIVGRVISQPIFDSAIGCVIIANSVCIGIETSYMVDNQTTTPPVEVAILDKCFLTVYCMELLARFFAFGVKTSLKSHWVKFDTTLVVCGLLDIIVSILPDGDVGFGDVMLVRILRIARLARTARLMVQFRNLWMLVQGLMHSMLTLLWTLLIVMVLCYVFAIMGMEIFAGNPEQYNNDEYTAVVQDSFSTLLRAMMTMFQYLTLDDVNQIHRPLIQQRPVTALYFVAFVLVTPIALMNLVTAIMVESSMNQSNQDQEALRMWEEQTKKALLPKLTRLFHALDEDGSGTVDLEEINNAPTELQDQMRAICNGHSLDDLFHQLDYDMSGELTIDEFCEGLLKAGSEKPVEFHCLMMQCRDIISTVRQTLEVVEGNAKVLNTETPMSIVRGGIPSMEVIEEADEELSPNSPHRPKVKPIVEDDDDEDGDIAL